MDANSVIELDRQLLYAGFWNRVGAHILDNIILTIISLIAGACSGAVIGIGFGITGINPQSAYAASVFGYSSVLVSCVVIVLYYALFESSVKQATPGKQVMKIIVVDRELMRLSFSRAAVRAFIMFLPLIPVAWYGADSWAKVVGFAIWFSMCVAVAWTTQSQGLHDILAGCLVVKRDFVATLTPGNIGIDLEHSIEQVEGAVD